MPRFFAPPARWTAERVSLDEAEGRHAVEVLRLGVGDTLTVFDGVGREGQVRLTTAGKRCVEGALLSQKSAPLPDFHLTLVQAVPKGKNFEWILEKAAEIGAASIVPILTERTVVRIDAGEREGKREKWEKVLIEACKQCGQNWIPKLEAPLSLSDFLKRQRSGRVFVGSLYPGARPFCETLSEPLGKEAAVLVGPEGDFTPDEMQRILSWGAEPVRLVRNVLRAETAALYCLSVLANAGGL